VQCFPYADHWTSVGCSAQQCAGGTLADAVHLLAMLSMDSGRKLRGSKEGPPSPLRTARLMSETIASPADSTPSTSSPFPEECRSSPAIAEVVGWGNATKPVKDVKASLFKRTGVATFTNLQAGAAATKKKMPLPTSDDLPHVSATESTREALERMVEEKLVLVRPSPSGTACADDWEKKPISSSSDPAKVSPNDVRSLPIDAPSASTAESLPVTGRLSPSKRMPSGEWDADIRLRRIEHAQRLHRAAGQANTLSAARKMAALARAEETNSWPDPAGARGLQRSSGRLIGYFYPSSDTEAHFSRWTAGEPADQKHEFTPLRCLLMSLHAIFGCDRALR
jgi:hypothetical protein